MLTLSMLAMPAFASGEASGDASGSEETEIEAMVMVSEEGTQIDRDFGSCTLTAGEIGEDAMTGVEMTSDDYTMNIVYVSGGRYTLDNCVISKGVSEVPESAGGVIAHVSDGLLLIRDSSLTTTGKGGIRFDNYPVECSSKGTMVVVDSEITQTGFGGDENGYTADVDDPPSNEALTISGYARASMSLGTGSTYYYGSKVTTEGWAAMSTDMGSVKFYAYDSDAVAQRGGYGTYADTSCSNWFYGCRLQGAEIGAIISNNGAVRLYSGAAAGEDMFAGLKAAGMSEDDIAHTDRRSTVIAGRNCFQLHAPEESKGATRSQIGIVEAYDTDLITSLELNAQADLVDWAADYGPALGEYVDFVSGAVFLVKSHVSNIHLTRCTAQSYSGVLLMTAVNSDSMGVYALNTHDMTGKGTMLTLTDCGIAGDVCAYDYQRSCAVTLENTVWTGAYRTWDKDEWDSAWSDACAQDAKCYWLLDENAYNTGTESVTSLTVGAGSIWNVSGESDMDMLTTEAGAVINGTVYVDGGTYTSNGLGSPAIYSTADVNVANATLVSNLSEGVCIEGINSITLENCDMTANNTQCNGNATFLDTIMIYQSMSGDADSGTSTFSMTDGSLTSLNGHMFHVTNTNAVINLSGVDLINEDSDNVLLSVCADGWNGDNNIATLNADAQTLEGTVLVGDDSQLTMNLSNGSRFTGNIDGNITNAKGDTVSTEVGTVSVTLDDSSVWVLTADSYVSEFNGDPANVYSNGYTLYVAGETLSGTSEGMPAEEAEDPADALIAEETAAEEAEEPASEEVPDEEAEEAPAEEVISTQDEVNETAADNQPETSAETQQTSHTGAIVAVLLVILCAAVIVALVIRNRKKSSNS